MSASEALTIWMFNTDMKVPSVPPATVIQAPTGTAGVTAAPLLRSGVDRGAGGQARAQPAAERALVEHDLHWHALHDLGEVAGGIVGRQQRELPPAGRGQALDMAADRQAREGVDLDGDGLARPHRGELRLLVVGHDI